MRHLSVYLVVFCSGIFSPVCWSDALTVTVTGMADPLREHVQTYLDIYREQAQTELSASRLQRLHERAEEQIRSALHVYGFYRPDIQTQLQQSGSEWQATYTVDPGTPIPVQTVNLQVTGEGRENEQIQSGVEKFPFHQGQAFEHPRYKQARDRLLRTAIEQGYLDAQLTTHEVLLDLETYQATINLTLATGPRFYFGEVRFIQEALDEEFLKRYVRFKPGDPYSPEKVLGLQTDLSDSGLFQRVEVEPLRQQSVEQRVPIDVHLPLRERREWRFGLGYATDTGARGSIYHSRIVGREGNKFDARFLLSEKRNSLTAGYTIPLEDPATDQLGFGAHYTDEETDVRQSTISGLTSSHTTYWGDWLRVISLNYEREVYVIGNEPEATKHILFPVLRLERIRADDRLYTRHGSRVVAELRGANENLLSDTNFGQLRLGLKWIRGLGNDSRILLRGDFGTTNVADLDKLPASQRFYAGGDNSVRGYAYEELGPTNSIGEVIGGKHLLVGSVELEHRLVGNWSAAAFYDIGNAINSFGDELAAGAGMGLRWNSPVGPVRFDFAWALDKTSDRFRLHVVIGPDL